MSLDHALIDPVRRRLLLAGFGLGALALLPRFARAGALLPRLVSAAEHRDGRHFLGWQDGVGTITLDSGFRGHGIAAHPRQPGVGVLMARRPGREGLLFDLGRGEILARFQATAGRIFGGHAVYSADGRRLYTSESDAESGAGWIGIRDAATLQWQGEWSSGGVGPHELALSPDGRRLIVANGGIHTDGERNPLNLDEMRSSLVYLDAASGAPLAEFTVPERYASLRHLAVAADGRVAVVMQFQRAAAGHERSVPLLAFHDPGADRLRLVEGPEEAIRRHRDYIGSVAIHPAHGSVALTSPRGDLASFWDATSGSLLGEYPLYQVCGVAALEQGFVLSNPQGELRLVRVPELVEDPAWRMRAAELIWDNHLLAL